MVAWLPAVASLGSAYLGYKAQQDQNKQTQAQNALLQQQYEWQKSKEVPGVAGAQQALGAGYITGPGGQQVSQADYDALAGQYYDPSRHYYGRKDAPQKQYAGLGDFTSSLFKGVLDQAQGKTPADLITAEEFAKLTPEEQELWVEKQTGDVSAEAYAALTPEQREGLIAQQDRYQFQSQFQPFVDAAGQSAVAGTNIAQQYLANVPAYQQAGLQGLGGYQALAGYTPD